MTILVSGGSGHVGLAVAERAAREGHDVVALVRSQSRIPARSDLHGRIRWQVCDLCDPSQIEAVAKQHDVHGCIHTAAVPNDRLARPDPLGAVHTNMTATAGLLDLARRCGWRRFVHVSTGSVFQDDMPLDRPVPEDAITSPRSVYGVTKRASELLVRMYRGDYDLSAAVVRISFVYGPPLVPPERDLPRGPVVAFLREALLGQDIREPSGGDFQASFTHIDDVAAGLLAAYEAPALNHETYHLGHGRNWTTFEVAEAVRRAVPGAVVEVGPGTEPWTTYNRMRGPLAGTNLADDTGFSPQLSLEAGVAAFADWLRANPERLAGQ